MSLTSVQNQPEHSGSTPATTRYAVERPNVARVELITPPWQHSSPPKIDLERLGFVTQEYTIKYNLPFDRWSRKLKSRFDELVVKEATDGVTVAELRELDELQKIRRDLTNRRTGKEILRERELRDKARQALEALSEFFHFVGFDAKD